MHTSTELSDLEHLRKLRGEPTPFLDVFKEEPIKTEPLKDEKSKSKSPKKKSEKVPAKANKPAVARLQKKL
jgi:hypothetical protein